MSTAAASRIRVWSRAVRALSVISAFFLYSIHDRRVGMKEKRAKKNRIVPGGAPGGKVREDVPVILGGLEVRLV